MKHISIRIIILTVFAWSACFVQAAGEDRTGLYAKKTGKSQVTESLLRQTTGLYEVQSPPGEGTLRAGGTEGDPDGNPNKVPAGDSLLPVLLGTAACLLIRKYRKRRFLDL